MSASRWVGAAGLAMAALAAPVDAADITAWGADRAALSPNGDGVADSVDVSMTYTTSASVLDSLWIVLVTPDADIPIAFEADVPVTGGFAFRWGGRDIDGGAVPDSTYDMRARIAADDGPDSAVLAITVDTTGPGYESVALTGPAGALSNGDFLQLRAALSEPADSVWVDVSSLDDDTSNYGSQFYDEVAPADYALAYRISDANTRLDRDGITIGLSARDSLGNESAYGGGALTVCLSNTPPLSGDGFLVNPAEADTLPSGFAYTTGDTIRVLACYSAPFDTISASAFEYVADFSDIDTEFNPFLNPAVLELETVIALPESLQISPQYPGRACVQFSYVLSEANATPDGTYEITVTATDLGCGAAAVAVLASVADLGPDAPRLDDPGVEGVAVEAFTLTGIARDAFRVEILDPDTRDVLVEATPDSSSGGFSASVVLEAGPNRFVAIAYDAFRHASPESNVIEISFTTGFRVSMPDRFFPGNDIEVSALDPVSRYDLDIFNLAGDRVHRDTAADPGEVHAFTWDGRNRAGRTVGTGPYVARITRHALDGGKDVITRAFVFTRK